ncbi:MULTISPECIES: hypothetical protein [Sulfurisphaera]|uniref:Uncharacterized protein n=2 Tax=Sulfurisphaera TaxID=69655 RepID=A0A650CGC3_SULOH|nr:MULTISPECIES: hypothetical protein [Sulfurisphaera]MBB5252619.1 hypothetical protein [Sulfurisphaera ohwakuensis]QGR16941.1 hypothetical protein D1869_06950 [Sulfurisphaera ohwakuensis]HII73212.1 hypothetical protein [Sulfurisphaera tokodaii]
MICEKVFRSRAGKTVILRVYDNNVEVTGDFFTTDDDLRLIEDSLSKGKRPNAFILGVDIDELYEKFLECVKK